MTEGQDTIGQVRVDVAELKGILTTVIADYGRRLTENESVSRQLRVDLTAVNDNLGNRINILTAEGAAKRTEIENKITQHTENILDLKADVIDLHSKHNTFGTRVATYVTPIISVVALIVTTYVMTAHHF